MAACRESVAGSYNYLLSHGLADAACYADQVAGLSLSEVLGHLIWRVPAMQPREAFLHLCRQSEAAVGDLALAAERPADAQLATARLGPLLLPLVASWTIIVFIAVGAVVVATKRHGTKSKVDARCSGPQWRLWQRQRGRDGLSSSCLVFRSGPRRDDL